MSETRNRILRELENEFDIHGGQFYLLSLIPLIEMIWADGKPQDHEVSLLREFLHSHVAELRTHIQDEDFLTTEEINTFLDRFLGSEPDARLLKRLRELAASVITDGSAGETRDREVFRILDYCLDIAAASTPHYPYGPHERFSAKEKQMLYEIMKTFNIHPDTPLRES